VKNASAIVPGTCGFSGTSFGIGIRTAARNLTLVSTAQPEASFEELSSDINIRNLKVDVIESHGSSVFVRFNTRSDHAEESLR
jgi:hypothetical protein